jgi:putative aldouronate transport system substrate-binding protein
MKKHIFKQAVALMLSLITVTAFTACDINLKKDSDSTSTDTSDTSDVSESSAASDDGGDPDAEISKITMMVDTTITEENGLQDICDEYEKDTGIKLEVEKPDHAKYYQKLSLALASENPPDLMEVSSDYYPKVALSGDVWDMTDAWENSTSNCKKITDEGYVDALKVDGKLYGFPTVKGNGVVTYVRGDWLDDAGLKAPKNYDEFINMLKAFKKRGGGVVPFTSAGLINTVEPYDIYLREFYQDAYPDFYKDSNGKYVDGFTEDSMRDAINRMREAYSEGLIDANVVTNNTSTCRDKFTSGLAGTFNYWAGMWAMKLDKSLKESGYIEAIPSIEETAYIERIPTSYVMSVYTENKAAVFEKFLMYSHDGGKGQMLFTHGVEGIHYKVDNGQYTALPYMEDPDTLVEKAFYSPQLSYTSWNDPFPVDERITESFEAFYDNRVIETVPAVTKHNINKRQALLNIKLDAVSKAVTGEWTVDEAMEYYNTEGAQYINDILDELNG